VERDEYDEMLRTLGRIAAHQDTITADQRRINDELRGFNQAQLAMNDRLDAAIARLDVTLAEVKNIVARRGASSGWGNAGAEGD